jgi:hypothetical protein
MIDCFLAIISIAVSQCMPTILHFRSWIQTGLRRDHVRSCPFPVMEALGGKKGRGIDNHRRLYSDSRWSSNLHGIHGPRGVA